MKLILFFGLLIGNLAHAETPLTVSAAASLKEALTEIKAAYLRDHDGVTLTFNFGGSGLLQQQIENGAPVDAFISAAPRQMDALEQKGLLLTGTRRDLVSNTLVLIAPKNTSLINGFADLAKPEVKHVIIGDPKSVPAGTYAAEVFAFLKIREVVESKLVRALDVRQVLGAVATGNAEAGVVYLTDVKASENVRMVATAPAGSHARIVYPVAVIKDTKHAEAASAFVEFLAGTAARAVFTKHGFNAIP
jgi:molybdate transport system substrate-binding protein